MITIISIWTYFNGIFQTGYDTSNPKIPELSLNMSSKLSDVFYNIGMIEFLNGKYLEYDILYNSPSGYTNDMNIYDLVYHGYVQKEIVNNYEYIYVKIAGHYVSEENSIYNPKNTKQYDMELYNELYNYFNSYKKLNKYFDGNTDDYYYRYTEHVMYALAKLLYKKKLIL